MTAEELLRRGRDRQEAGDLSGAEEDYRAADQLGDASAAIMLGLLLKQGGDPARAADAFSRAEARGHPEAASSMGNLLWDQGDIAGARAAFERSVTAGSIDARLNLGLMLAQEGATDEALPYLRSAEEGGLTESSWAIGKILEDRDDLTGAEAAYRRGAGSGDANAAYGLGYVLMKRNDVQGARAAFVRADELGHQGAGQVLQVLAQQVGGDASAGGDATAEDQLQRAVGWVKQYVTACQALATATDACLDVAWEAVSARETAARRPQHEISIETFTRMAEAKEQEFMPLYRTFAEACAKARDTATGCLAAQTGHDPEMVLARGVEAEVLGMVATAKAILNVKFGYTPAGFIEGMRELNTLMQNPFPEPGHIWKPAPSEERACPWCAETIKAAAVVCRFCGRDVQPQPATPAPS